MIESAEQRSDKTADDLSKACDADERKSIPDLIQVLEHAQVDLTSRDREEYRCKEPDDQSAQLALNVARQDRRFANEDPNHKRSKHRVNADPIRDQGHA